jgi:hypothetical protein
VEQRKKTNTEGGGGAGSGGMLVVEVLEVVVALCYTVYLCKKHE